MAHGGRTILGLQFDWYTPVIVIRRAGVEISAPCSLAVTRAKKGWQWVVGFRMLGFGFALSKPEK